MLYALLQHNWAHHLHCPKQHWWLQERKMLSGSRPWKNQSEYVEVDQRNLPWSVCRHARWEQMSLGVPLPRRRRSSHWRRRSRLMTLRRLAACSDDSRLVATNYCQTFHDRRDDLHMMAGPPRPTPLWRRRWRTQLVCTLPRPIC